MSALSREHVDDWGLLFCIKMKTNEKRTGIWIPIELIKNKDLDWTNRVLLSEILSLNQLKNGCHASNEFFAELLGINKSAASKRISQLKSLGYIQTKDIYEKTNCVGRIITITSKCSVSGSPVEGYVNQKNNHSQKLEVVPKPQGGSSNENQGVLPERREASSQTIKRVVPEGLGGSSQKNPINTINNSDILIQYTKPDTGENGIEISSKEKNQVIQKQELTENSFGIVEPIPNEFFEVLVKRDDSGWNSLSVREAGIFYKYKKQYNEFLDDNPDLGDMSRL